jgi:transposase-like protein
MASTSRGHRAYSAAFKLKVVQLAESKGKHHASKFFNVDRKRVREWCQKKNIIEDLNKSAKRAPGAGRKPRFQVLYM